MQKSTIEDANTMVQSTVSQDMNLLDMGDEDVSSS